MTVSACPENFRTLVEIDKFVLTKPQFIYFPTPWKKQSIKSLQNGDSSCSKSIILKKLPKASIVLRQVHPFPPPLTDTGENGTNWPVYFRLAAESHSSLGPVGKKQKKIACPLLDVFACGQVSSPHLYRFLLKYCGSQPFSYFGSQKVKF